MRACNKKTWSRQGYQENFLGEEMSEVGSKDKLVVIWVEQGSRSISRRTQGISNVVLWWIEVWSMWLRKQEAREEWDNGRQDKQSSKLFKEQELEF
jgi:hypothetical protein